MNKTLLKKINFKNNKGAVSLFVVVFSAFLFVAVTVGFTVLMVSDQNRATDNDLAQSARDSAEAGIEEAKRVLAQLESCNQRNTNEMPAPERNDCERIARAVSRGECGTVREALGMEPRDQETIIKKDSSDETLDQAYTCVKINPDTLSYEGRLDGETDMRVVPVRSVSDVSRIRVSWVKNDATVVGSDDAIEISPSYNSMGLPIGGSSSSSIWSESPAELPSKSDWNSYGSILRVGSFQYPSGEMRLAEIDSDSRTAFLYPTTSGAGGKDSFSMDDVDKHTNPQFVGDDEPRNRISIADIGNIPQNIRCDNPSSSNSGTFLCQASFDLAQPITAADGNTRTYLTLSSIYNSTEFRVELLDENGDIVRFQNVQPEVDVTGRASNVLRRLVARVESADASRAPYPRAALGSSESICKAYMITDSANEFTNYSSDNCPSVTNPSNPW